MKKTLLTTSLITTLLIILLAASSLANSETILSLSSGVSTGVMGFTLERINNSLSFHTGFGVTPQTLRLAFGSRFYLPEKSSSTNRSNIFIGPSVGFVWERNYDYREFDVVFNGYDFRYWAGITGGYDHRWGALDEYRLTFEGGFGFTQDFYSPYIPILNISLGYSF